MLDNLFENKFFKSILYFSVISIITTIFWYFEIEAIGLYIYTGIAVIILVFSKNALNSIPVLINMLFMVSKSDWLVSDLPTYLFIIPSIILVVITYHVIRYKVSLRGGKLNLPFLLMLIAMILSIINIPDFQPIYGFYYFIGVFYLATYVFFKGSIKGDNLIYIIRFFSVLGVMIAIQVFLFYIKSENPLELMRYGDIHLGWGLSNFVATYLVIFSSMMFYYIKNCKYKYIYLIIYIIEALAVLMTASKGGVLAFGLTTILLIIYLIHNNPKKHLYLMYLGLSIGIATLLIAINFNYFETIYHRVFDNFWDDNDRFILWNIALEKFLAHPLFGVGFFAEFTGTHFRLYHNTFIHTMTTMGLVGLAALIWQIVEVLKIFFKKMNKEKAILLIALIGANIHGMVDNVYYMPQFMIIFFLIVAAVENQNELLINTEITLQ